MDPIRVDTRYTTSAEGADDTGYTPAVTVAQVALAIAVIGGVDTGYTTAATGPLDTRLTIATITVDTGYDAAPPLPVAPVNTAAPVASGTPTEGETLSCTTGTWTGTMPITYSYQWWRTNGPGITAIGGATASTYTLTATEVGEDVWCVVTATNVAGLATEPSNTVGPIASAAVAPVNTVAPVASGVVRIGEVLSCTTGTWTGTPTPTITYQWRRDGVDIGGATSSSHTVVDLDMATELDCVATATNVAGADSEPSNTLASPWQPILVARPGVLIWDGLDPQCYGGTSVSAPVEDLFTVDGIALGTQALTAAQGTRLSGALELDGGDDHYPCDAHAGLVDLAHTLIVGWSTPSASGTRSLVSAALATSTSSARQIRLSYAQTGTAGARRVYYHDGATSINLALTTLGATDENIVTRSAAPGGAAAAAHLDATLTAISSGSRPGGANSHSLLTIGAVRYGAVPTVTGYWGGSLRHLALHDEAWDDTDALLYRTCALAAGVM